MVDSATDKTYKDYLLIVGDISFDFEISALFYGELAKYWRNPENIIAVLGNHELWGYNGVGSPYTQTLALDDIVQRYRDLFSSLGICFLQNDLLPINGTVISEEQLKSITPDELKYACLKHPFMILGGIGFSGLCRKFNATNGIYRSTVASLDEDIKQTKRFASIYDKVKSVLGSDRIIVLTHTSKDNWSDDNYNSNWIYVNGHTHRNDYCCSPDKTFYSDNQIGYNSTSIGLKPFYLSSVYDVFKYYPNGIHVISREQYLDFNKGVNIHLSFNRTGKVYMLKNSGVYCFLYESQRNISLLNGGALSVLKYKDINYYYERMVYYSDAIKSLLNDYYKALKSVAISVKKIGGKGTVHGCIVDIDYDNHIYVNPEDGTITPYFAFSVVHKFVYPNVAALLLANRKDLHDNYMKFINTESEDVKLLKGEVKAGSIDMSRYVSETYMYRPSRILKSLQYLTEVNVIRVWNDRIMDIRTDIEQLDNKNHK
jgi:hypothetical protein